MHYEDPTSGSTKRKHFTASQVLQGVVDGHQADTISFGDLMVALHERGFGLLMMVFVLPNCVPVPIPPPLPTVFSIPLLFLSIQMLIGRETPWLPKWLENKRIKRVTLAKMVELIAPKLRKVERILRPRFSFASSRKGERAIAAFWVLFSLSIAVPLPMTNFVPGVGILVMSLGLLSRDGLVIGAGICVGLGGVAITTGVILLGHKAVMAILGMA